VVCVDDFGGATMTSPFVANRRTVRDVATWRTRIGVCTAAIVVGTSVLVGLSGTAGAARIAPAGYCKRISAATVGSLYGGPTPLLGAQLEGAGNDVCEFASFVGGALSGVTVNYDYKGTGTIAANIAALKKEKGVRAAVFKSFTSIGGTTYSFRDTFIDSATKKRIKESGMVSFNGANHFGVVVTKVLGTAGLERLMQLVVRAAT
jgi:hypothetical protein